MSGVNRVSAFPQTRPGTGGLRAAGAAALVVLSVLSAAGVRAADRAELYGFAPAYPAAPLPPVAVERNQPFLTHKRLVRMVLEIDASGRVTGAAAADSTLGQFANYLAEYLSALPFVPAHFEGQAAASRLPVDFLFEPMRPAPEALPAVDHTGRVVEAGRYFDTFPLNGIRPPRIVEFPSLFADLHWSDTASVYPYVLLALEIDSAGRVTAAEAVRSTLPSFTQTTLNAALWATYDPLVVRGERRAGRCFVLAAYYPQVIYPTKVWRAEASAGAPILERTRVRLMPDTVGLLAPPVPRLPTGDSLDVPGARVYSDRDTSGAVFAVDPSGRVSVQAFDTNSRELTAALRRMAEHLKFYPALTLAGGRESFRGMVFVTGLPSGRLRINYVW
ncbi:MAG TPA: hypothetical protein PK186_07420 [candidate division Zixibacteria bacterium]|nr:hypothetical protein [candidate division Zixibacteria bacterium]MDD4918112.1 hypothetical protein [candidate division Zixibacteria bacterium]MDM7972011.1 hypothetical protein [candidate division Zixibacteria bacterium]HOD67111.1 hypothetical protein [candidate division Zixibacteria bacterium]HPM37370.1 hypothetical protein [candidate division Zixibacteria bacterium]